MVAGAVDAPSTDTQRRALFPGLVFNEQGERAEVVYIGGTAHYAIADADFVRHVEASHVDDAVLAKVKEQIVSMQDQVVLGILQMLGRDDLLTKAAIEASIRNLETGMREADPEQWVPALRLFGFRVVVDIHGDVVEIMYPQSSPDE
jgi:hypothetical protein